MSDTSTGQESASFIDPSVLQASDGTVHLVVDACPSYCGLMSGNRMGNQSSGFDAQGRMIVALAAAGGDAPTAPAPTTTMWTSTIPAPARPSLWTVRA